MAAKASVGGEEDEDAADDIRRGNPRRAVERKIRKRAKFVARLTQAQDRALKAKGSAIGKAKSKRKGASKALRDFDAFRDTLLSADLAPSKPKQGKLAKAKTSRAKSKILVSERDRLSAVVSHPVFQSNPLQAIRNHLAQTLPQEAAPTPARGAQKQKQKRLTPQQRKQLKFTRQNREREKQSEGMAVDA